MNKLAINFIIVDADFDNNSEIGKSLVYILYKTMNPITKAVNIKH